MKHKLKLTLKEKIKACFDLSDFVFRITKNTLSEAEFNKRLSDLRKRHLEEHIVLLKELSRIEK